MGNLLYSFYSFLSTSIFFHNISENLENVLYALEKTVNFGKNSYLDLPYLNCQVMSQGICIFEKPFEKLRLLPKPTKAKKVEGSIIS